MRVDVVTRTRTRCHSRVFLSFAVFLSPAVSHAPPPSHVFIFPPCVEQGLVRHACPVQRQLRGGLLLHTGLTVDDAVNVHRRDVLPRWHHRRPAADVPRQHVQRGTCRFVYPMPRRLRDQHGCGGRVLDAAARAHVVGVVEQVSSAVVVGVASLAVVIWE